MRVYTTQGHTGTVSVFGVPKNGHSMLSRPLRDWPVCHLGLLAQGSANSFCKGQDVVGFVGHVVYHIFLLVVAATAGVPLSLFLPPLHLLHPFKNAIHILSLWAKQNQATGWLWPSGCSWAPRSSTLVMKARSVREPRRWGHSTEEACLEVSHSGSTSPLSTPPACQALF